MSLNPEPADPVVRKKKHLPPKSYADAADGALRPHPEMNGHETFDDAIEAALEQNNDVDVDEDAIKESPPRPSHIRTASSPRPLGEVMDEIEHEAIPPGSPSLRHTRGRLEEKVSRETYADAVKQEPTSPHPSEKNGVDTTATRGRIQPVTSFQQDTGSGSEDSKSTRAHLDGTRDEKLQEPGGLVYENLRSKSGENLASIQPTVDILHQRVDTTPSKSSAENGPSELTSGRQAGAGWATSAIRWAPLNVPIQRRLQTLMILIHTLSIGGGLALFFLLCAIPLLWPILLPYLLYVLLSNAAVDGKLRQRSQRLRSLRVWSLFAGYFPARLHRSHVLEPTRKYIFGYHPHGIISHGAFAAFATEALGFSQLFPGITNTLLTLDSNFRIPLYRDYALRMGLASVSRESCENILSKGGPNGEGMGRAITIVIGGARESLDAKPRTLRLVLKRRKGFVKLAIRTGADLVPVLAFGENDIYDQVDASNHPFIHKAQLLVKRMAGFTVPLFHARGVFNYDVGMMPYRRPINIVVGKPIQIMQAKQPDPAYVDEVHQRYVDELLRLWDEWKDEFAKERTSELEIIE